jgi:hypothetical protein
MAVEGLLGDDSKSMVVVHFPTRREIVWASPDSALFHSEEGQRVTYGTRDWLVSERNQHDGLLRLHLTAVET